MTPEQMKQRTKLFALDVIRLVAELPNRKLAWVLGDQLLRSGTSVGANYRAACKARSRAEFIAKIGVVEEEADESQYWLELVKESGLAEDGRVAPLHREAYELTAIMAASRKSAARSRENNRQLEIGNRQ